MITIHLDDAGHSSARGECSSYDRMIRLAIVTEPDAAPRAQQTAAMDEDTSTTSSGRASAQTEPGSAPESSPDAWTTKRLLEWMAGYFADKGLDSPRLHAEILLSHVFECDRLRLYTAFDRPATPDELNRLRPLVARAGRHEPVAYLTNDAWFFGRSSNTSCSASAAAPRPRVWIRMWMPMRRLVRKAMRTARRSQSLMLMLMLMRKRKRRRKALEAGLNMLRPNRRPPRLPSRRQRQRRKRQS